MYHATHSFDVDCKFGTDLSTEVKKCSTYYMWLWHKRVTKLFKYFFLFFLSGSA